MCAGEAHHYIFSREYLLVISYDTIDQSTIQTRRSEQQRERRSVPVIAVEGLRKSFGNQTVLNGISLSVNRARHSHVGAAELVRAYCSG